MERKGVLEKEFVIPGSFLGAEEEFMPGQNTFGDSRGGIHSTCVGFKEEDLHKREVTVLKQTRPAKSLEVGATVLAAVTGVREQLALVELLQAQSGSEPLVIPRAAAIISIRNISEGYVKDIDSVLRIGDIVRARVIAISSYSVELTIKGRDLGVIKAFCVRCRHKLLLFGSALKCINCGNNENRKLAEDYLLRD